MTNITINTFFSDAQNVWWNYYKKLPENNTGAYHRPDYFFFQEKVGFGRAVLQIFSKTNDFIYFPTMMKPLPNNENGFDINSSWYYGGPVASWSTWAPLESIWIKAIDTARNELAVISEFIRFDPNLKNAILLKDSHLIEHNRDTVFVDLNADWDHVWKNFSSQNRRNVNKAKKNGLIVTKESTSALWDIFSQIYQEEMIRKNAPKHLRFKDIFFIHLKRLPNVDLFIIREDKKGEIVGGFIAVSDKNTAFHYLSATKYDYWELRPNNLLFTEVIKYYYNNKRKVFDFQGGREGVFRFKCNFSKKRRKYFVGKKIYNEVIYDALSCGKETTFFPAYRDQT